MRSRTKSRVFALILMMLVATATELRAEVESIDLVVQAGDLLPGELVSIVDINFFTQDLTTGQLFIHIDGLNSSGSGIFQAQGGGVQNAIAFDGQDNGLEVLGVPLRFDAPFSNLDAAGGVLSFVSSCAGSCTPGDKWVWTYDGNTLYNVTAINTAVQTGQDFAATDFSRAISNGFWRSPPTFVQTNQSRQTAFVMNISESGTGGSAPTAIWISDDAGLRPVLLTESAVAGIPTGTFNSFTDVRFADSAALYVEADIRGPGVDSSNSVTWFGFFDGLTTQHIIAREGDAAPDSGGLTFTQFGGDIIPGPGSMFVINQRARVAGTFGGSDESLVYFGNGTSDLVHLLPAPDNFGRFNVSIGGADITFNDVTGTFGADGQIYLTGYTSAFSNIFQVDPENLTQLNLLADSNTDLPDLIAEGTRTLSLLTVAEDGTILLVARQAGQSHHFLRSAQGQYLDLPSVGSALGGGVISSIGDFQLRSTADIHEVNFLTTIVDSVTSDYITEAIYRLTFSFPEIGRGFFWDSTNCGSDNWHVNCGSINFDDEAGLARSGLPGPGDDVTIDNADVVIDALPVSINSIAAAGSLTVAQALTLVEDSSIEGLVLESTITSSANLLLTGSGELRSGEILGSGSLIIETDQLVAPADANIQISLPTSLPGRLTLQSASLGLGQSFRVEEGGELMLADDTVVTDVSGGEILRLFNSGLISKTGLVSSSIEAPITITETGVLNVSEGALDLTMGGSLSGRAEVDGELNLSGGAFFPGIAAGLEFAEQFVVTGTGDVTFDGITIMLGDADFNLTGAGGLLVRGNTMFEGEGSLTNSGKMTIEKLDLAGRLINRGLLEIDQLAVTGLGTAKLDNEGTLILKDGASLSSDSIFGNPDVTNTKSGLVQVEAGATATIAKNIELDSEGDIHLLTGATLSAGGAIAGSGTIDLGSGARFELDGSLEVRGPGLSLTGDGALITQGGAGGGAILIRDGATLTNRLSAIGEGLVLGDEASEISGGALLNRGGLTIKGGQIDVVSFSNEATVTVESGRFSVDAGVNTGLVVVEGLATDARTLDGFFLNDGMVEQKADLTLEGTFDNGGTYRVIGESNLLGVLDPIFINRENGTFIKEGQGLAEVDVRLTNYATIEVTGGDLKFGERLRSESDEVDIVISQSSTVTLSGGALIEDHEFTASGSGLLVIDGDISSFGLLHVDLRVDTEWRSGTISSSGINSNVVVDEGYTLEISGENLILAGGLNTRIGSSVLQPKDLQLDGHAVVAGGYNLGADITGDQSFTVLESGALNVEGGTLIEPRFSASGTINVFSGSSLLAADADSNLIRNGELTGGTWNIGQNSTVSLVGDGEFEITSIGPGARVTLGSGARLNNFPDVDSDFTLQADATFGVSDRLNVAGTLTNNGGTLGGTGTITTPLLQNEGTVAPGTSPGILTVVGDYNQTAAGMLAVEIDGNLVGEDYDRLVVTGSANFEAGSVISVILADNFVPVSRDQFDVLIAADISVTDNLESLVVFSNSPAELRWVISTVTESDLEFLRLEVLLGSMLADIGDLNAADRGVALAIDDASRYGTSDDFLDFALSLEVLGVTSQKSALSQLRFSALPQVQQLSFSAYRSLAKMIPDRQQKPGVRMQTPGSGSAFKDLAKLLASDVMYAQSDSWRVSVSGFFEAGNLDATRFGSRMDFDGSGLGAAVERMEERWRVGLAFASTRQRGDEQANQIDHDASSLIVFGDYSIGNWHVNSAFSIGRGDLETRRRLSVGGPPLQTLAKADTQNTMLSVGIARPVMLDQFELTPFVNLTRSHTDVDPLTESGSINALVVSGSEQRFNFSEVGIKLASMGRVNVGAELGYEWVDLQSTNEIKAIFAAAPNSSFAILADEGYTNDDAIKIGVFISGRARTNLDIQLSYQGRFGRQSLSNSIYAQASWWF